MRMARGGVSDAPLTESAADLNLHAMTIALEQLSLRELSSLLNAAEKRQALLASRPPIGKVRRELVAFAAKSGYTIEEVLGAESAPTPARRKPGTRRRIGKAAIKYRDPDNRRNKWTGRGSMPRWLAGKVKQGRSIADFLIPGLARPTARNMAKVGQRKLVKRADAQEAGADE